MKAAELVAPCEIRVGNIETPEPGPGEIRVKVALCGLCGSDHSLFHGKMGVRLPVIPGHEAVGSVEKIGPGVQGFSTGQRVTIQPNFPCRQCDVCRGGNENICPSKVRLGLDINGTFAEYVKVPAAFLHPIPDGLEDAVAVFAEPLAVGVHALKIASPRPGERTLVLGAGVIGLLILQLAMLRGGDVGACDLEPRRLDVAKALGAAHAATPEDISTVCGKGYDLIYETSGAAPALAQAIHLAAPKGRIAVLSLPAKEHPVPTTMIVRKELTIVGSIIYTDEFPLAIQTLYTGRVNTNAITSGVYRLEEAGRLLTTYADPERLKVLLTLD